MIRAGDAIRSALLRRANSQLLHDMHGASRRGQEIVDNVDSLAGALVDRNLSGAKIGLWYQNSIASVEAFLAVEWIGGTRIPVDPNAPAMEASAIFQAANVDVVLTDAPRANILGAPALVHDDAYPLRGEPCWPQFRVPLLKTAVIYPRSVNNGQLFGIPFSYGNWNEIVRINMQLYTSGRYGTWAGDQECFLAAQQIMHGTGLVGTYPFLTMGLPQILVDVFDAERVLDAIARYNVTATMLVPTMLMRLAKAAEQRPASSASLRHVLYGGGPVIPEQLRHALQTLGPVLVQVYGRMEGGWPITVLGTDEHRQIFDGDETLISSCGKPIDEVHVKLRSNKGSSNSIGELVVRSSMGVAEYCDDDGWCALGDIMRRDERGYLFFDGRNDRMINTGYHVYPAEIETAIAENQQVADVLVVGEANVERGNTIVAYVVARQGVRSEDLIAAIKAGLQCKLAKYKIPRVYHVVERLPDTPT